MCYCKGMKLKLTVFGANLRDQSKGAFVVHTADCKDCKKLAHENKSTAEYGSYLEVSADIWSDMINEGSMTAEEGLCEIHFAPCVKFPSR